MLSYFKSSAKKTSESESKKGSGSDSDSELAQFVGDLDKRIEFVINNATCDKSSEKLVPQLVKAYDTLTKNLKERSDVTVRRIYAKHVELALAMAQHAGSPSPDLSERAGKVLGGVLFLPQTQENFNSDEAEKVVSDVIENILKATDKAVVTRTIWILNQQKLSDSVIEKKIPSVLDALTTVFAKDVFSSYLPVQNEIIRCYSMLNQRCPRAMILNIKSWVVTAIRIGGMTTPKVRERVVEFLESFLAPFLAKRSAPPNISAVVEQEETRELLKNACINLQKEMKKDEISVLKLFALFVRLLGKCLHNGTSLLNSALKIVEAGFKSPAVEAKSLSFKGWHALVENFALDMKTLLNKNRLKLLMQPLNTAICPTEEVATEKLKTWWTLCVVLGSELEENFSAIAIPLLRFCVGGKHEIFDVQADSPCLDRSFQTPLTPKTPQLYSLRRLGSLNLNGGSDSSSNTPTKGKADPMSKTLPIYDKLQAALGEILAKILIGKSFKMEDGAFENSRCEGIQQPITVLQHGHLLFQCLRIWAKSEAASKNSSRFDISIGSLDVIFRLLAEASSADAFVTVVESALLQFRAFVEESSFSSTEVLRMYSVMTKHLVGKVEHLQFGEEKLSQECVALYLLEPLLFTLQVLNAGSLDKDEVKDGFSSVLHFLVKSLFLTPQARLLDCVECFFTTSFGEFPERIPGPIKVEVWEMVASKLQDYLNTTSEVNQGDKTDPNFVCAHVSLGFPVIYIPELNSPADCKNFLLNQWKKLYQDVNRCVSLVSTTEPNTLCHDFSNYLLKNFEGLSKDPCTLYTAVECSKIMLDAVDYGAIAPEEGSCMVTLSPMKFTTKKKLSPLRQLHPVAKLVVQLLKALLDQNCDDKAKQEQFSGGSLGGVLGCLITLFDSVTVDCQLASLIELFAEKIGKLLKISDDKESRIPFKGSMTKVDLCLTTLCNALRNHYGGPYDSQFLEQIEPILEAAMTNSRRTLKNEIITFWGDSFAKASALNYSENLKKTLLEVKQKSWLLTPGLGDDDIREEPKPVSPVRHPTDPAPTQNTTEPLPSVTLPGQSSPQKTFGSLLKRNEDAGEAPATGGDSTEGEFPAELRRLEEEKVEEQKESKAKKGMPQKRKNLSDDFVEIAPVAKKPMVLTPHQKEKLQTRTEMPFMDISESQDVPPVLPSEIFAQSQDASNTLDSDDIQQVSKAAELTKPPEPQQEKGGVPPCKPAVSGKSNNKAKKSIAKRSGPAVKETENRDKKDDKSDSSSATEPAVGEKDAEAAPLTSNSAMKSDPKLSQSACVMVGAEERELVEKLTTEEIKALESPKICDGEIVAVESDSRLVAVASENEEIVMETETEKVAVDTPLSVEVTTEKAETETAEKEKIENEKPAEEEGDGSPDVIEPSQPLFDDSSSRKRKGRTPRKFVSVNKPTPHEKSTVKSRKVMSPISLKKLAKMSPNSLASSSSSGSAGSTKKQGDSTPKRGRGRPKKQPTPMVKKLTESQVEESVAIVPDTQPESQSTSILAESPSAGSFLSPGTIEKAVEPVLGSLTPILLPNRSEVESKNNDEPNLEDITMVPETLDLEPTDNVPDPIKICKESESTNQTIDEETLNESITTVPDSISPSSDEEKEEKVEEAESLNLNEEEEEEEEIRGEEEKLLTPGILKKAPWNGDATSPAPDNGEMSNSAAKHRHVHFAPDLKASSDDEEKRRKKTVMIEGKSGQELVRSLETGDKPKSGSTPPASFTKSFTPRTLRMLEAVQQQNVAKESSNKENTGSAEIASAQKPVAENLCDEAGKPVCPDLVDCSWKIDSILPRLTSTTFIRGLSNLLKAKGLSTIGGLAKLTETEVQQLPLKAPKVLVLRLALEDAAKGFKKPEEIKPVSGENKLEELDLEDDRPLKKLDDDLLIISAIETEKDAIPNEDRKIEVEPELDQKPEQEEEENLIVEDDQKPEEEEEENLIVEDDQKPEKEGEEENLIVEVDQKPEQEEEENLIVEDEDLKAKDSGLELDENPESNTTKDTEREEEPEPMETNENRESTILEPEAITVRTDEVSENVEKSPTERIAELKEVLNGGELKIGELLDVQKLLLECQLIVNGELTRKIKEEASGNL